MANPPTQLDDSTQNCAALSRAASGRDAAVKACGAWSGKDVLAARTDCVLKADKAFTTAIALTDMDLIYGYASFLKVDMVGAEIGRQQPGQMAARHKLLWSDFLRTLEQDHAMWRAKRR
jgi:hypothetical protein